MQARFIKAEHLRLALWLRKFHSQTTWSAMSNGFHTYTCSRHKPVEPYCHPHEPQLMPIIPCTRFKEFVDKVRFTYGVKEVKRTWGIGYRELMAKNRQERLAS